MTNFSKYCNFTSLSKIGSKRVQTFISYTNGDRKIKANSKGKFEVKHYFLKSLSQNFDFFLTFLKVLTSHGDAINPKMAEKGPNRYFMYQC